MRVGCSVLLELSLNGLRHHAAMLKCGFESAPLDRARRALKAVGGARRFLIPR